MVVLGLVLLGLVLLLGLLLLSLLSHHHLHLRHHLLLRLGVRGSSSGLHGLELLHVLHVLLPPLGHGLGGHASVGVLGGSLGGHGGVVLLVAVGSSVSAALAAALASALAAVTLKVAGLLLVSVFGPLDLNGLVLEDEQRLGENLVHGLLGVKGDESETSGPARVLVDHELCVDDGSVLLEERLVVLLGHVGAHAANKDLGRLVLLFSGDGPLGVDDLAVEVVLLGHDGVDALGLAESQEAKASGLACEVVSHDRALEHLAKLGKVVG